MEIQDSKEGLPCLLIIIVFLIFLAFYIVVFLYLKFQKRKERHMHECDYCGRMVYVISNCCHAPVGERFPKYICLKCKKACELLCVRCKSHLSKQKFRMTNSRSHSNPYIEGHTYRPLQGLRRLRR